MKTYCQKKLKLYVTREFCLVSDKYYETRKISTSKVNKVYYGS